MPTVELSLNRPAALCQTQSEHANSGSDAANANRHIDSQRGFSHFALLANHVAATVKGIL